MPGAGDRRASASRERGGQGLRFGHEFRVELASEGQGGRRQTTEPVREPRLGTRPGVAKTPRQSSRVRAAGVGLGVRSEGREEWLGEPLFEEGVGAHLEEVVGQRLVASPTFGSFVVVLDASRGAQQDERPQSLGSGQGDVQGDAGAEGVSPQDERLARKCVEDQASRPGQVGVHVTRGAVTGQVERHDLVANCKNGPEPARR